MVMRWERQSAPFMVEVRRNGTNFNHDVNCGSSCRLQKSAKVSAVGFKVQEFCAGFGRRPPTKNTGSSNIAVIL